MIREQGFDVLATRILSPEETEFAAARTRGGNWEAGRPYCSIRRRTRRGCRGIRSCADHA